MSIIKPRIRKRALRANHVGLLMSKDWLVKIQFRKSSVTFEMKMN